MSNIKKYIVIEEESGDKTEYGLALTDGTKSLSLPRLSENRADINEIAEMLNSLDVDACHFEDIVEDYLTDFRVD